MDGRGDRVMFETMCGRYMLTMPVEAMQRLFRFAERPNLPPRYNIAPSQDVPVVRRTRLVQAIFLA